MSRDSPSWKPRMTAALHSTGATLGRATRIPEGGDDRPVAVVAAWPPLTRRRPTRCSARTWPGRISPGPSTAKPCCVTEKPWYYEHESRPHLAVIGARLSELIGR